MLYIKPLNEYDIEKEWEFLRELPPDENGLINNWSGASFETFRDEALPKMFKYMKGEGIPASHVPEAFLFLWDGDEIVGHFRIRHYLCESLRNGSGHIGYTIRKDLRGRGYATKGLAMTLDIARCIVPEDEFYLSVRKTNIASQKVQLKNGGRIVGENDESYFIRIDNPGMDDLVFTARIEQTDDYPERMKYFAETDTFRSKGTPSLSKWRGVSEPYGWIVESGTPPCPHLDVIIMTDKHYELGAFEKVRVIGVFLRNDGDNKYVGVPVDRDITELSQLTDKEKEDLHRLYPHEAEGEGWFGREMAAGALKHWFERWGIEQEKRKQV